jgi:hypothetical protein
MQKHSRTVPGGRAYFDTERLWQLAADLPVEMVAIDAIAEFDQNCWFGEPPTCREVARHAKQMLDADLDYPVLLSSDGRLMDGRHRIGKAWLLGLTEVKAQRFTQDPEPDWIEPSS